MTTGRIGLESAPEEQPPPSVVSSGSYWPPSEVGSLDDVGIIRVLANEYFRCKQRLDTANDIVDLFTSMAELDPATWSNYCVDVQRCHHAGCSSILEKMEYLEEAPDVMEVVENEKDARSARIRAWVAVQACRTEEFLRTYRGPASLWVDSPVEEGCAPKDGREDDIVPICGSEGCDRATSSPTSMFAPPIGSSTGGGDTDDSGVNSVASSPERSNGALLSDEPDYDRVGMWGMLKLTLKRVFECGKQRVKWVAGAIKCHCHVLIL